MVGGSRGQCGGLEAVAAVSRFNVLFDCWMVSVIQHYLFLMCVKEQSEPGPCTVRPDFLPWHHHLRYA